MSRLLELFKGTGSVGEVFTSLYPDSEIISLDINPATNPTHCCDIINFQYEQYPRDYFSCIWASPDCTYFSTAQYRWIKSEKTKDSYKWESREHLETKRRECWKYVERVVQIIEYFNPPAFFIENPARGAMRHVPVLASIPKYEFAYCQFGFLYQKPTAIWSNRPLVSNKCKCIGKHIAQIGNKRDAGGSYVATTNDRYKIPAPLLLYLLTT